MTRIPDSFSGQPDDLEGRLDRFEQAWQDGAPPRIADFLAGAGPECAALLHELVRIDLEYRWRRDGAGPACDGDGPTLPGAAELPRRPRLEDYVAHLPELGPVDRLPLSLAGEEYRARAIWGDRPAHASFAARFPGRETELSAELAGIDREIASQLGGRRPPEAKPAADTAHLRLPGYEILGELGRGGMGIVYRARQLRPRRQVAVKVLRDGARAAPRDRARFRAEADAVALLRHANIVPIHEVGEEDGCPYFVMELVEGGSLAERIAGTLQAPREAAQLIETLAHAIHHAHGQGVVHRDLKPANILLTVGSGQWAVGSKDSSAPASSLPTGHCPLPTVPKITDFGLARQLDAPDGPTQSGVLVGTPGYMAPEQAAGKSHQAGPAADVYSLGAILYELLTGRPPFRGESLAETLHQIETEEPVHPRRLQPRIPRDLETVCLKCLEKLPRQRYASAEALADDLGRFLAGRSVEARPVGWAERGWKWARRRPAAAALLAVSAVAVVSLLGLGGWSYVEIRAALDESNFQRGIAEQERTDARASARRAAEERDQSYSAQQREGIDRAVEQLHRRDYDAVLRSLGRVPVPRRGWEWQRLDYEHSLAPRSSRAVGRHDWGVAALLLSRDGRLIVSSGHDGRVVCWRTDEWRETELEAGGWSELHSYGRHVSLPLKHEDDLTADCFLSLCWLDDGRRLAGASLKGRVVAWDVKGGGRTVLWEHPRGETCAVIAATESDHRLVVGDASGVLFRLDTAGGPARAWSALRGSAIVGLCPLGLDCWAVAQAGGAVTLADPDANRVLDREEVRGQIWDLAASADGRLLAVASSRGDLITYRVERPTEGPARLRRAESYHTPKVVAERIPVLHAVRVAPDGRRIAAGDESGRVLVWSVDQQEPSFLGRELTTAVLRPNHMANLPPRLTRRVAGIEWMPAGTSVFIAGHSTLIEQWDLVEPRGVTELDVAPQPHVLFDRAEPGLLWVGGEDGSLTLWDSRPEAAAAASRTRALRPAAHRGPVIGIDVSRQNQVVVTGGADGFVRFWKRVDDRIEPAGEPIEHGLPLRCVAVSSDGGRVAAYDADNNVLLWEATSGRPLAQRSVRRPGEPPAVAGVVAFNADGSLLVVLGPGQTSWLLDGTSLEIVAQPGLVSGAGGTTAAFHPRHAQELLVGDTGGRVAPWKDLPHGVGVEGPPDGIIGLAYTPDGSRVAVATRDGRVAINDPLWLGHLLQLRSARAALARSASGLVFDPAGDRLALTHTDGHVEIWETTVGAPPPPWAAPRRRWDETVLLDGERARGLRLRPESVALDAQDRLCMVFSRLLPGTDGRREVVLGRETPEGFQAERLEELGPLSSGNLTRLAKSLALRLETDRLVAAAALPPGLKEDGYDAEFVRYECAADRPGIWRREIAGRPLNHGFFLQLLPPATGEERMLHHNYYGPYLVATTGRGDDWRHVRVGRAGDGWGLQAAAAPDGRWHALFVSSRFPGEYFPLTYLREEGPGQAPTREVIEMAAVVDGFFLAMTRDGTPEVLYFRRGSHGSQEMVLATRDATGWRREIVPISIRVKRDTNLTCDRHGKLSLAWAPDSSHVFLLTGAARSWAVEPVWRANSTEEAGRDKGGSLQAITLVDSHNRPVVVLYTHEEQGGWLRVLRAAE